MPTPPNIYLYVFIDTLWLALTGSPDNHSILLRAQAFAARCPVLFVVCYLLALASNSDLVALLRLGDMSSTPNDHYVVFLADTAGSETRTIF